MVRGLFETGGVDLVDLQFLGLLDVLKSFALRVIHAKHLQLSFYLFALLLVRLAVALAWQWILTVLVCPWVAQLWFLLFPELIDWIVRLGFLLGLVGTARGWGLTLIEWPSFFFRHLPTFVAQVYFVPEHVVVLLYDGQLFNLECCLNHLQAFHEKVVSKRKVQIDLACTFQKCRQLCIAHLLMKNQVSAKLRYIELQILFGKYSGLIRVADLREQFIINLAFLSQQQGNKYEKGVHDDIRFFPTRRMHLLQILLHHLLKCPFSVFWSQKREIKVLQSQCNKYLAAVKTLAAKDLRETAWVIGMEYRSACVARLRWPRLYWNGIISVCWAAVIISFDSF